MLKLFPSAANGPADALWVDLFDPTDDEIKQVGDALSIAVPDRAALEEIESSSRLQFEDGIIQLSVPVSAHADEEGPSPVGFVLTPKYLITVRYTQLHAFDATAKQCSKEHEPLNTSADIFTALIEGMVDYGADMLEGIGKRLNILSREVFRRYSKSKERGAKRTTKALRTALIDIGTIGDQLAQIRESLLGLQRLGPFVSEKGDKWLDAEIKARLKTVGKDLISLADFETHLSNKVQFLLDAILGFLNTEQNDIFKVLTIASVIGIPPTFIASMYGMNFHNMPEYGWTYGYEWGLFLIVVSTIVPIIWFKWRGWW